MNIGVLQKPYNPWFGIIELLEFTFIIIIIILLTTLLHIQQSTPIYTFQYLFPQPFSNSQRGGILENRLLSSNSSSSEEQPLNLKQWQV